MPPRRDPPDVFAVVAFALTAAALAMIGFLAAYTAASALLQP